MLYLEGKHYLADHNLNYTDKMSMAVGVEVRVPLLDPDLVRLATQLPLRFKQNGSTGKWIFKRAMEPFLPRQVIYRRKTGFGAPLRHWLRHQLRPVVDDTLSEASLRRRGLFEPKAVRELIDADRTGRVDAMYSIFSLMCIEMWCRRFLDVRAEPASVPSSTAATQN
jgi:asparagine synthase (glutamine-hydrolysing)